MDSFLEYLPKGLLQINTRYFLTAFSFWDRLMGTMREDYEEHLDQATQSSEDN